MDKLKFGTDGWRAIIAKDFTVENVARVSLAVAQWLKQNFDNPSVVVGHDCRFGGELFAETVSKVMIANGIKVNLAKGFVSTPMISLGAINHKASLGIILTASHNPPTYNGYKLKGYYGGPLSPEKTQEIEDIIPDSSGFNIDAQPSLAEAEKNGMLKIVALEDEYIAHVEKNFDLDAIRNSGLNLAYDAMYGAGQNVIRRLFDDITLLHCDYNPSFDGQAPEPIHKNLKEFSDLISMSGDIDCGLATDGDADRIGLYDNKGEFVDSHHILLLLIHYLAKYKGMKGKVITAFSTTAKMPKMCAHYGLEHETVKIGFKYIASKMLVEDVLVGGEESGGIAVAGHIPERDGIWMGLVIWEFMAKTGKKLHELIAEVYEITGPFAYNRNDMHIEESVKLQVLENCKAGKYTAFGNFPVHHMEDLDGFKYYLTPEEWIMIRASGTEPILRVYAEASTKERVVEFLDAAKKTLLG